MAIAPARPVQVWQLAGKPDNRPHMETFLRSGVALIGPGDPGPWKPQRPDTDFADELSTAGRSVRAFAGEMQLGDVVLLRSGIATIAAVGIVASEYCYLDQFDDVNGWDLQHARRVRWTRLPQEFTFAQPVFGANPARCSRVWNEVGVDYATRFVSSPPTAWQQAPLPALPPDDPPLFDLAEGLLDIVARAKDLGSACWDRQRFGDHPSEDEIVGHLVLPFLRALGWPPERIAIKWRYVDVAVFRRLPRVPENCQFIIEAKRLGSGVEGALRQAMGYVDSLGLQCDVVVTDGIRYRLYETGRDFESVAYANLERLKRPAVDLFARLRRP